ncbi:MAG: ABC transporter permease, partial [Actinomycetia bacterium]|nr:ABC transporter permease [Actinomycetes bacterium]
MSSTISLGTDEPTGTWGRVRRTASRRTEGRGIVLLTFIIIMVALLEPLALTAYEVTLGRIALIGIVALGLTAVILMGELDLSVASTLAVAGVIMASIPDLALGIVAALVAGLVVGVINAFFVAVIGINSFIATLGTLFALRGLAFVLSNEAPVSLANKDAGIAFGQPLVGPLTPR